MSIYSILSALLDYPEQPLVDALDEIDAALAAWPHAARELAPLIGALRERSLIESQQEYVATFDRNPSHSLHLFEHVHGESRERGQAMVDLLDEYRGLGFDVRANELPDYVPLFLEVLSLIDEHKAESLLNDAVHVLSAVGARLADKASPYAGVFAVLRRLATAEPRALTTPPVRDMDEALEVFGTGPDGVEPLLTPQSAVQTIHFHSRGAAGASGRAVDEHIQKGAR